MAGACLLSLSTVVSNSNHDMPTRRVAVNSVGCRPESNRLTYCIVQILASAGW